ncbi:MAG: type III-B CRISPR module-associated protein Cmr3 [Deltaproteobacteria bacterium]|nr:type III-B CRISPR module-associated protein Cmr3 [Deltaproteobacteria bacterium]
MTIRHVFIEPVDVLYLRGNRLFADAGHGEAVMPPWPSLFAGALRSRILADARVDFDAFRRGEVADDRVRACVGRSPAEPGEFRIVSACLARNAGEQAGLFTPAASDLDVVKQKAGPLVANSLHPVDLRGFGIAGSGGLPRQAVLRSSAPAKSEEGIWLDARGMAAYLRGGSVAADSLVKADSLWKRDPRLGIGLDGARRTAAQGLLYTSDTVALGQHIGFLVGVAGAGELLPTSGLLRLGGDGRGAAVTEWSGAELPRFALPTGAQRFRMILSTPGWFGEGGWLPPGVVRNEEEHWFDHQGFRARLVAAAVPRAETVSGWDLAEGKPKAAVRVVPPGSVYWFDRAEGSPGFLEELTTTGLWPLLGNDIEARRRRAEGYNNVWIGAWPNGR